MEKWFKCKDGICTAEIFNLGDGHKTLMSSFFSAAFPDIFLCYLWLNPIPLREANMDSYHVLWHKISLGTGWIRSSIYASPSSQIQFGYQLSSCFFFLMSSLADLSAFTTILVINHLYYFCAAGPLRCLSIYSSSFSAQREQDQ